MTQFQNQKVENLIHDIESISMDQFQIGLAIRELFFKLEQSVTEDVKYGGLIFSGNKEMMSGIFFYKEHISIEFGQGSEFSDSDTVLEGKGKFRRHIKINNYDEIISKKVEGFIQQAIDKQ